VWASGGQKPQFWANLDIWGADAGPNFWCAIAHPSSTHAKFHLNVFIVLASGGQKPQLWANFDLLGLL